MLSLQQVFKSLLQVLELPSLFASIYTFEFSFVVVLLITLNKLRKGPGCHWTPPMAPAWCVQFARNDFNGALIHH